MPTLLACRNKALRSEVEYLSKRGTAAQQLHDKLNRQLVDVAAELAQLQQLVDATEQAQQQAAALAEQLRLHDDAEALAVSEAEKQLQACMLARQEVGILEQQVPQPPCRHCSTQDACSMAKDEAALVLEQLKGLFLAAGVPEACPAGSIEQETPDSRWQALLQQVQQRQASNIVQFKQCMLANQQLGQVGQAIGTAES